MVHCVLLCNNGVCRYRHSAAQLLAEILRCEPIPDRKRIFAYFEGHITLLFAPIS